MATTCETILATLPGSNSHERTLVVLCQQSIDGSRMELRQQTWGVGVGWFTQSTVSLEPHQVAQLRMTLGTGGPQQRAPHSPLPKRFRRVEQDGAFPRVMRADSA